MEQLITDTTPTFGSLAQPQAATAFAGRWRALVVLAAAQFMVVVDLTVVNVALPSIQRGLHISLADLSWVINVYAILFGGLLLAGGRAADFLGRRAVFLAGMAIFAAASLAGGLANTQGVLFAARAVQGLGGALLAPAALSIVLNLFADERERTRALAIWGSLAGLGGTAGVLLGGALVDAISWRWVLFINVPIAAVAAVFTLRLVPAEARARLGGRIDLLGPAAITAALLLAVYGIVASDQNGWGSRTTVGSLVAAAVLLAAFVLIESLVADPMVPLRIFRRRGLVAALCNVFFVAAAFQPILFLLTQYLQNVLGFSPFKTGAAFVPLGLAIIAATVAAQSAIPRLGVKPPIVAGALLLIAALVALTRLTADGTYAAQVLPALLLSGVGVGFSFAPALIAGTAGVAPEEAGLASGVLNATLQVGAAVGVAVVATIASDHARAALRAGATAGRALSHGFTDAFATCAWFAAANLVAAVLILRNYRPGSAP